MGGCACSVLTTVFYHVMYTLLYGLRRTLDNYCTVFASCAAVASPCHIHGCAVNSQGILLLTTIRSPIDHSWIVHGSPFICLMEHLSVRRNVLLGRVISIGRTPLVIAHEAHVASLCWAMHGWSKDHPCMDRPSTAPPHGVLQ